MALSQEAQIVHFTSAFLHYQVEGTADFDLQGQSMAHRSSREEQESSQKSAVGNAAASDRGGCKSNINSR